MSDIKRLGLKRWDELTLEQKVERLKAKLIDALARRFAVDDTQRVDGYSGEAGYNLPNNERPQDLLD